MVPFFILQELDVFANCPFSCFVLLTDDGASLICVCCPLLPKPSPVRNTSQAIWTSTVSLSSSSVAFLFELKTLVDNDVNEAHSLHFCFKAKFQLMRRKFLLLVHIAKTDHEPRGQFLNVFPLVMQSLSMKLTCSFSVWYPHLVEKRFR